MKTITEILIQKFKTYLTEEEHSTATVEKYIRDLRFFKAWIDKNEITKNTVLEYKQKLCREYAPVSVNSILSSLNSFFEYVGWHDIKIKTLKIQKQLFANKAKELTKSEYERLLMAAKKYKNKRLYYLMQTICSTGIRVSELKFITVETLKNRQAIINCKGKLRIIFLPKQLCRILKEYIKEKNIKRGSVFVSKTGKPLDRSNIWTAMKKLCESAGVSKEKVFPHNLRHLFARTYYSVQKDLVRLADILGHSSINTTRIYTIENGEIHRQQMEKLGFLKC